MTQFQEVLLTLKLCLKLLLSRSVWYVYFLTFCHGINDACYFYCIVCYTQNTAPVNAFPSICTQPNLHGNVLYQQ